MLPACHDPGLMALPSSQELRVSVDAAMWAEGTEEKGRDRAAMKAMIAALLEGTNNGSSGSKGGGKGAANMVLRPAHALMMKRIKGKAQESCRQPLFTEADCALIADVDSLDKLKEKHTRWESKFKCTFPPRTASSGGGSSGPPAAESSGEEEAAESATPTVDASASKTGPSRLAGRDDRNNTEGHRGASWDLLKSVYGSTALYMYDEPHEHSKAQVWKRRCGNEALQSMI